MNVPLLIIALFLAAIYAYIYEIRPRLLLWGATYEEYYSQLHGDGLVDQPDFNATRAININAKPEDVWKWIVQIGSNRAGWYSIDWIDNGGIKSADTIISQYQHISTGQFIPFTPDQKNGMWVKDFKENEYILWADKSGKASWLWKLEHQQEHVTRLITRLRTRYVWKGIWIFYYLLYDMGDIVMMRKCLQGIKSRAENSGQ